MGEYPHVRVAGAAEQRGRQYGEQARDRVHRSVSAYRDVFSSLAGWDWETVRRQAARYEAPIASFGQRYLTEMRGIAAAAGAGPARTGPAECSAFAVAPAPGCQGTTLIGQNWDWLPHTADTVVVLEVEQDDGPDYVTVVEAGLLAKTGMNSSGLGLVTNALVTADDAGQPGLPYHVLLRAILDCENVSDAIASLQSGFRSSSANYLLAQRGGAAVDVEGSPGDFSGLYYLYPDAEGVIVHANHFLADRFAGQDVSVWAMPDSPVRLQRLRAGVRAAPDRSLAAFRSLLADHANYPSGVCCHPNPRMNPVDQGMTAASVLMDLDARMMWVSDGNPCTAPYRRLDYSSFLAKTSPVAQQPAAKDRPAA